MTKQNAERSPNAAGSTRLPEVSPNNPCPFLRALVAGGYLGGHIEPLPIVSDTIARAGGKANGEGNLSRRPVYLIALIANGLSPAHLWRNAHEGIQLDGLRDGPLDKHGAGSRILDSSGHIDEAELERLDNFAIDKSDAETGRVERGLGADQLRVMMDANFARAAGSRRRIDRALMNGEWPVLLKVMGKNVGPDRYLSLNELRVLFSERRLPERICERIDSHVNAVSAT
jgi:hypothetical protein